MKTILKTVLITTAALLVSGIAGALIFIYSGVYSIAASEPHLAIVRFVLTTLQRRSVAEHAEGIRGPALDDAALVREGLVLYREYCVACHGAPGESRGVVGIGMNPSPPPLETASRDFTEAEIYWVITNGLKMAGMPAFDFGTDPRGAWAITAFIERMRTLSTLEYRAMVAAVEGRESDAGIAWVSRDQGWDRLRTDGNATRGATHIAAFGCTSCHVVPGIPGPRGKVGPPLTSWGRRHFIAGLVANTPENLVPFLLDPQALEPGTAMPDLGVTPEQALDIAAYLYSLP